MSDIKTKNFDKPDKEWTFLDGSTRSAVIFDSIVVGKGKYLPGWRWSKHVGKLTGRPSEAHTGLVLSGRFKVKGPDGTEADVGPNEVFVIGPGHDAWVQGNEPCIALDFENLENK